MVGGEGDDRGWDGWMTSPTQWTWVWVSSGSWWWTGRPGVLRFMGLQRIGYNWATELNWTDGNLDLKFLLCLEQLNHIKYCQSSNGLPWWLSSKESACNEGDPASVPGLGRSPGGRHGNPLQYSCLENLMDRGTWWAIVHRVTKSCRQLSDWAHYDMTQGKHSLRIDMFFENRILFSNRRGLTIISKIWL